MPSYLITGASRGLGYGFLQSLSRDPSNTIIGLVRNISATRAKLSADGLTNVHLVEADITDSAALARAAKEAEKFLGGKGLDVLVNNAAWISTETQYSTFAEYEDDVDTVLEDMRAGHEANVLGVLKTVYAFLPLIKRGTLKKVVAISSGMGDIAFINETLLPVSAPYSIQKAALSAAFAKLHAAYHGQGILFLSICPGLVETSATSVPEDPETAMRMQDSMEKLTRYAGGQIRMQQPEESAASIFAMIQASSVEGGQGGTFRSHSGKARWM